MILFYIRYAFDIFKKFFAVIFTLTLIVYLFILFSPKNSAPKITTSDLIKNNRNEILAFLNDKEINSTKQGKALQQINREFFCRFVGEGCSNKASDTNQHFNESFGGMLSSLMSVTYANPPASGTYWVYNGLQNAGFIPKTYAQGIGFAAIQPLSNVWKVFRDAAYLFLVLAIVLIGFMIMFRVKINPQTVISLENSLPRIILSLILITFSFAIAGFMIDLMYVILAMSIAVLGRNTVIHIDIADYQNRFISGGVSTLFDSVFTNGDYWGVGQALFQIMPNLLSTILRIILTGLGLFLFYKLPFMGKVASGETLDDLVETGKTLSTVWQGIISIVLIPLIFFLSPFLLSIAIFISAIFVFFRIVFILLKSYVTVLILIIFSPLILLLEVIPGRKAFSGWIKNLFANLLAFPVVAVFLVLSLIISAIPASSGTFWKPPFFYNISPNAFSVIIGTMILFLIPEILKKMKGFLGIKESGLNFGVGALFAGPAGAVGLGGASLSRFATLGFHMSHVMPYAPAGILKLAEKLPVVKNFAKGEIERRSKGLDEQTAPAATGGGGG